MAFCVNEVIQPVCNHITIRVYFLGRQRVWPLLQDRSGFLLEVLGKVVMVLQYDALRIGGEKRRYMLVKTLYLLLVVFFTSDKGFYEPSILSIRLTVRFNLFVRHNNYIQVRGCGWLPTSDTAKQHRG